MWDKISLPKIKNMDPRGFVDSLVSIQPLQGPLDPDCTFLMEIMDSNHPVVGQIFHDKYKFPHDHGDSPCMCCLRGPSWSKIYTPQGWVYEETEKEEYEAAVKEYNPPYRRALRENHIKMCEEHNAKMKKE